MAKIVITVIGDLDEQVGDIQKKELETEERYYCEECEQGFDKPETDTKYECVCGNSFTRSDADDSNRCPDCNKFGAKTEEAACIECSGDLEFGECGKCIKCEEWIALPDYALHFVECGGT